MGIHRSDDFDPVLFMARANPEPVGVKRHGAVRVPLNKYPSVNGLANWHLAGEPYPILFEPRQLNRRVCDTQPSGDLRYEFQSGHEGSFGARLPVQSRH